MSRRILHCRELLDEVFMYFGTKHDYDGDPAAEAQWRTDLLNAALVCRDYRDPALDVLWSHMKDLRPLFLVLCELRHKKITPKKPTKLSEQCPIMIPTQSISSTRCLRFQFYANKIRSIDNLNGFAVDVGVWSKLSHANGGLPLFPRLRRAVWYLRSTFEMDLLPLLPLEFKSIEIRHLDDLYGPNWQTPTRARKRQKRMMSARDGVTDYMITRLSQAAPDLQRLRIRSKHFVSLVLLSYFKQLTDLSLDIQREFDIAPVKHRLIPFHVLQSLTLHAPLKSIRETMEKIDCPQIRSLDVKPWGPCTREELTDCLGYIGDKAGMQLEHLAVHGWKLACDEMRDFYSFPLPHLIATVLPRFPALRSLVLSGPPHYWRAGFGLKGILHAAPRLRSLKMVIRWELPRDMNQYILPEQDPCPNELRALDAPTLDDLIAVPQLCPALRELELPLLDARRPPKTWQGAPLNLRLTFRAVKKRAGRGAEDGLDVLRRVCPDVAPATSWLDTA